MNKSCGGCTHWNKWKKAHYKLSSDGLCNLNDWRCASDYVCEGWKGKKFNRLKEEKGNGYY